MIFGLLTPLSPSSFPGEGRGPKLSLCLDWTPAFAVEKMVDET